MGKEKWQNLDAPTGTQGGLGPTQCGQRVGRVKLKVPQPLLVRIAGSALRFHLVDFQTVLWVSDVAPCASLVLAGVLSH